MRFRGEFLIHSLSSCLEFCANPQATTIEDNLSISSTEVAITDHAKNKDNKVGESEPAVTTAGEIAVKIPCSKRNKKIWMLLWRPKVYYWGDIVLTQMGHQILMSFTTL